MGKRRRDVQVDTLEVEASLAAGGLAIFDRNEILLQSVPADITNALRYFLSRLWQSGERAFPPMMAVTSALSGEGVTVVARSIAAIIAHDLDRNVCLLETNWWSAPGSATLDRRTGLADVLSGRSTVDDALVRTSDDRLAILTSGEVPVAGRPAVASGSAFTDVLKLLQKVFDVVIIDAPPVLKAPEATTVVRHADAVLLVVRQGVTTETQLATAVSELQGTELGVVINRTSTRVPRLLRRFVPPT